MKMRKKHILWIIGTVTVAVVIVVAGPVNFHVKERKAVKIAQDYLSQKYDQEMRYESIRFSWIDPSLYHVSFSPVSNPKIVFDVMVQQDITIQKEWTNKEGDHFSPDNYYIACFEYFIAEFFQNEAKKIWDDKVNTIVRVPNKAIYSYQIPEGLNDMMSMNEQDGLIEEYLLLVEINKRMDESSKVDEVNKIFEFIEVIRNNTFDPDSVVFWYDVPKSKENKTGRACVSFNNWRDITSINQIIMKVDEELL